MQSTWEALRDIVFRTLYKMGYKIGQLFVQAGKSLFLQAIESGIRTKVREFMNSNEVMGVMEKVLQEEMDLAVQQIATELGLDSTNTNEPPVEEVEEAVN